MALISAYCDADIFVNRYHVDKAEPDSSIKKALRVVHTVGHHFKRNLETICWYCAYSELGCIRLEKKLVLLLYCQWRGCFEWKDWVLSECCRRKKEMSHGRVDGRQKAVVRRLGFVYSFTLTGTQMTWLGVKMITSKISDPWPFGSQVFAKSCTLLANSEILGFCLDEKDDRRLLLKLQLLLKWQFKLGGRCWRLLLFLRFVGLSHIVAILGSASQDNSTLPSEECEGY